MPTPPKIKVFISYSHDSDAHKKQMFDLAERLCLAGIDCILDQNILGTPDKGWPTWMEDQIEESDFVLVVATETYLKRYRKKEDLGKGKGATWEGAIITQELYDLSCQGKKFIPIIPDNGDESNIPKILKGFTHYRLPSAYDDLYWVISNQPGRQLPPVGSIKKRPTNLPNP